jgi:hypothetical protein
MKTDAGFMPVIGRIKTPSIASILHSVSIPKAARAKIEQQDYLIPIGLCTILKQTFPSKSKP